MLELAWPWVFLLLPLPWLIRLLLPPVETQDAALKISFLAELELLTGRRAQRLRPRWQQQLPFLAIWILLLLAAARPQQVGELLPVPGTGRDLLLAVDISGSMDTPDIPWHGEFITRLEVVKQLFGDFIEARHGDRVGLILFAGQAYVQSPLTFDRKTVRLWLEEARIGMAGQNTAIGEAIGLAIKRLRDTPAKGQRLLVLITDGANNSGAVDPRSAARLAANEHIKIHSIGIAAPSGNHASRNNSASLNTANALDEAMLRNVAALTGGQYFRAASSEALKHIGKALDQLEPVLRDETRQYATQALYPWPLAAALLGSLFRFARRLWPQPFGNLKTRRPAP